MDNVAKLPDVIVNDTCGPLPQRYEAARNAIAECERIDECKDWKDKGAAIRVYAMQVKDDSLRVMAVRIQARAEKRMGDLLAQYPDGQQTGLVQHREAGTHPTVTRVQAATDAGLSDHQRKTALRVAAVPAAAFEAYVESPQPPSITQLANLGKATGHSSLSPWRDIESAETREACATLERFVHFCERTAHTTISRAVSGTEAERLRQYIATADRWLDGLVVDLAQEW